MVPILGFTSFGKNVTKQVDTYDFDKKVLGNWRQSFYDGLNSFEEQYEKLKNNNRALSKKARKALNMDQSEMDIHVTHMYKQYGCTIYQVKWFFITLVRATNKKTKNAFEYLINVIDGQTGSGKSWLQLFMLTHTYFLYGDKTTFNLNYLSPFQVDDVLISNFKEILTLYKNNDETTYQLKKQLKDKNFMFVVHKNIVKKLDDEYKMLATRLTFDGKLFVYDNIKVKDIKQLETIFNEKTKIITIQSSIYFNSTILPILDRTKNEFDVKSNVFDEAHREGHTIFSTLLSLNTTMSENQYQNRTETMFKRSDRLGFTTTFFTGTSSWQQRSGKLDYNAAKELIDSGKIEFTDDKDSSISNKLDKKLKEKYFLDAARRGHYDTFIFHSMTQAEKNIVASKNAPLGNVYNLTDIMATEAKSKGKHLELLVGKKNNSTFIKGLETNQVTIDDEKQKIVKYRWLNKITQRKLYDSPDRATLDEIYHNYHCHGLDNEDKRVIEDGLNIDDAWNIMQYPKYFEMKATHIQRINKKHTPIDFASVIHKDIIENEIYDHKKEKYNINYEYVFQDYFKAALTKTIKERCFGREGIAMVKTAKSNSHYGVTFDDYQLFVKDEFSDKEKGKTLYWAKNEHRLANNSNSEQFKGMTIHDVLEQNPEIKMVVIIQKLEVGVSINNINSIFILKRERSINGEFMALEQLIGRGVRSNNGEPLDLIFLHIGKQEEAAIKRLVLERQTVLPVDEHKRAVYSINKFIDNGCDDILNKTMIKIITEQLITYFDKSLRNDIAGDIANALGKYHRNTKIKTLEKFHDAVKGIAKDASLNAENYMPEIINTAIRQGKNNLSDVRLNIDNFYVDVDYKFGMTNIFKPNYEWSLKGLDRTDGKLHLGMLYIICNIYIHEDGSFDLSVWLVEFYDSEKRQVSIKELNDNKSNKFKSHRIM